MFVYFSFTAHRPLVVLFLETPSFIPIFLVLDFCTFVLEHLYLPVAQTFWVQVKTFYRGEGNRVTEVSSYITETSE